MVGITVKVKGWLQVRGHTEYQIESVVEGEPIPFAASRRFSEFLDLHTLIQPRYPLQLPAAFPEKKVLRKGKETVKEDRVFKLEQYLQSVVAAANPQPPIELRNFLSIKLASDQAEAEAAAAAAATASASASAAAAATTTSTAATSAGTAAMPGASEGSRIAAAPPVPLARPERLAAPGAPVSDFAGGGDGDFSGEAHFMGQLSRTRSAAPDENADVNEALREATKQAESLTRTVVSQFISLACSSPKQAESLTRTVVSQCISLVCSSRFDPNIPIFPHIVTPSFSPICHSLMISHMHHTAHLPRFGVYLTPPVPAHMPRTHIVPH